MILNIRSPYFVTIDESGQVGSKVELFIWKTGTIPSTPTYSFSKAIASATQRENVYNISPFVSEFVTAGFVNVTVKRYKETTVGNYTLLNTVAHTAVNGYNNYSGGYNQTHALAKFSVLADDSLDLYYHNNDPYALSYTIPNLSVFAELTSPDRVDVTYQDFNGFHEATDTYNTVGKSIFNVPISKVNYHYKKGNKLIIKYYVGTTLTDRKEFAVYPICEMKYEPVICRFINRFGGFQTLTFFKAQYNNITTQGTKYNIMPSAVNYDVTVGKTKLFNINGNQSVRLNTGWVNENYNNLIQDLLLSDTIFLDGKPVTSKTQGVELKTRTNNKMINYEIEFDFAFDLINNVV
jgi:hypothetical protein